VKCKNRKKAKRDKDERKKSTVTTATATATATILTTTNNNNNTMREGGESGSGTRTVIIILSQAPIDLIFILRIRSDGLGSVSRISVGLQWTNTQPGPEWVRQGPSPPLSLSPSSVSK
jgi:hypothetical protein